MIRVGFVGTGGISRRHFNALTQLREQAEIVAVCDVIEESAVAAALPFSAKVFLSFPQMLARERLDALYVCLPPDAHVDQELAAIDRGMHLFVEKPLPLDFAKASLIARRVKETGVVTAVGYHWRYWDHVQSARRALATERIGMALGHFLIALPGLSLVADPSPFGRANRRTGDSRCRPDALSLWRSQPRLGRLRRAWGNADHPGHDQDDVYTANVRFQSGAIGNLSTCSILHRRFNVGLDVLCKAKVYRIREDATEVEDAEGIRRIDRSNDAGLAENTAFLAAIATGNRTGILSDYADALRTQRVVMAANRSAEIGEPVGIRDEG